MKVARLVVCDDHCELTLSRDGDWTDDLDALKDAVPMVWNVDAWILHAEDVDDVRRTLRRLDYVIRIIES